MTLLYLVLSIILLGLFCMGSGFLIALIGLI